jgi:hypothetical protein
MALSFQRRGACSAVSLACLLLQLQLLLAASAAAQDTTVKSSAAPGSASSSSSSSKHASVIIAGCKSWSKSGCTACKIGGILSGGKCYCFAGTGQYGTTNTEKPVIGRRINGASLFACVPCDANSYATPTSQLVGRARCAACPAGSAATEDRATCIVPPGFYYDKDSGTVKPCLCEFCWVWGGNKRVCVDKKQHADGTLPHTPKPNDSQQLLRGRIHWFDGLRDDTVPGVHVVARAERGH